MKNLKKNLPLLEYLKNLSKKNQNNIIKFADKPLLICLSEICLNLVKRNIPLKSQDIKRLKKYESEIRTLSEKKHSLTKRKKILSRGGLLPGLLSILPTLISGVISTLS